MFALSKEGRDKLKNDPLGMDYDLVRGFDLIDIPVLKIMYLMKMKCILDEAKEIGVELPNTLVLFNTECPTKKE